LSVPHVGLFAYQEIVSFQDLVALASALQQQVFHLQRWWGQQASAVVTAFPDMSSPHPGVWPIIIADGIAPGNGGYHLTSTATPSAYVQAPNKKGEGNWWTVMASHEFLEMVVDPWGNSRRQGFRPAVSGLSTPTVPVEYLLEICDPCVSPYDAYPIGTVWVSDFVTPDYYQPRAGSTQFSHAQRITGPSEVSAYGYVTWYEPGLGKWFQKKAGPDGSITFLDLGRPDMSKLPARAVIDMSMEPHNFDALPFNTSARSTVCLWHEAATKIAGEFLIEEANCYLMGKQKVKRIKKKIMQTSAPLVETSKFREVTPTNAIRKENKE